jgi:hypothetical protein
MTADVSQDWLYRVAETYEGGAEAFEEYLIRQMPQKPLAEILSFIKKKDKDK